ncbi:MAG: hypothetical protein KIH63_004900 [Candidatus Saccharibacteria bacterium]|nr:hypothetical protein [Candidatus Saccharibacteria bacterium]
MPNLREILPSSDGTWHRQVFGLLDEIGVAQTVFVTDESQELIGAMNLPSDPDTHSFAHLVLSQRLSHRSGGQVYSPRSLRVFSEQSPGLFYQVIFG